MNGLVMVGVVLAGLGVEAGGASTVAVDVEVRPEGTSVTGMLNAVADVQRDFGSGWAEAHVSLLARPAPGFSQSDLVAFGLTDLGSRLTLGFRPVGLVEAVKLEFSPFFVPLHRRASFDWRGNWMADGDRAVPVGFSPTLALELQTRLGTVWVASQVKAQAVADAPRFLPDVFLGLDVPLPASLRLELRGAWLRFGDNAGTSGDLALAHFAVGGAARLSWTWREPVDPMVDLLLYARDPTRFERFYRLERRRTAQAAQVLLEGGVVTEQLISTVVFAAPTLQTGGWVDLQGRLRLGDVRLFATARVDTAAHLALASAPSPRTAFAGTTTPVLEGRLGVDATLGRTRLTPGLLVTLLRPATVPFGSGTMVFPQQALLGPGVAPEPVLTTHASLRWDPAPFLSAVLDLWLTRDTVFLDPISFGGQLGVQARF